MSTFLEGSVCTTLTQTQPSQTVSIFHQQALAYRTESNLNQGKQCQLQAGRQRYSLEAGFHCDVVKGKQLGDKSDG